MSEGPAARLLALLELLQARSSATGTELAAALGVTERTLRRYVHRLVALGIPVESERGPAGGYRLRRGFRLPPLMLTTDEAVAVTLGLRVAEPLGVATAAPAAATALAKLERVLPDHARARVRALDDALGFVTPWRRPASVDPAVVAELGSAAGERQQVAFAHRPPDGEAQQRTVDPYGVVFHAGRWYVVGHDHLRRALRTFRVDRIDTVSRTGRRFALPEGFDAAAEVVDTLAAVPYGVDVCVVLHTDVDHARRLVPPTVGTVTSHVDGALLQVGATSADDAARHLALLGVGFTVVGPDEVREAVRALAASLAASADHDSP